jgi:hypothetical protein
VTDAERLAHVAEQHLLMGHEAGQPNRMDRDVERAVRRAAHQVGGAHGRAAGPVELAVMVELDDLSGAHVPCCLGREAHHQDRADGEIRRHEDIGPGALEFRQRGHVESRRPDHGMDPCGDRLARVLERAAGNREVDQNVRTRLKGF